MSRDRDDDDLPDVSGAEGERNADLSEGVPQIEGYRIIRRLGRGGMGVVYEAEQVSLGRRVALKVLPFAAVMDARQLQRFQNESRAAAQLHHTHIVPVYSVGCERGLHYYAMQYIEGQNLSEVILALRQAAGRDKPGTSESASQCVSNGSSPAASLSGNGSTHTPAYFRNIARLGMQVAEALDYAHRQGVIHRDIKPGNLMLDCSGTIWITDFGLAHLETGQTLTLSGDLLGTVRYLSPERALGRPLAADPRDDIYSLGATLYELLTLEPVFDGRTRQELLRLIGTQEPQPPRRLNRSIPADLETIVLKALSKTRADRYMTAQELADDLRRFLETKPILARRPSWAQRAGKWARRHSTLVAAAGMVLLAAIAALVVSTALIWREMARTQRALHESRTNARRAEEARDQARSEAERATLVTEEFLKMLSSVRPEEAKGRDITMREILDKTAAEIGDGYKGQPQTEAAMRRAVGLTYESLGLYDRAEEHLRAALEVRRRVLGEEHPDTLRSMADWAKVLHRKGDWAGAGRLQREALGDMARVLGPEHPDTLGSTQSLAAFLGSEGRYAEAAKLCRETLKAQERILGPEHADILLTKQALAGFLRSEGRLAEAEKLCRETIEVQERVLGPEHPDTLVTRQELAGLLSGKGASAEADRLYREVLETRERVLGPEHPDTLGTRQVLAGFLFGLGRYDESEEMRRQTLEIQKRVLGKEHPDTLRSMKQLADMLGHESVGKYAEAEQLYRQVIEVQQRVLGKEHPDTLRSMRDLADLLLFHRHQYAEAEALHRQVLEMRQRVLGAEHPETLTSMTGLGLSLYRQNRFAEAEDLYRQALGVQQRVLVEGHAATLGTMQGLARCLLRQGKDVEAETVYRQTIEICERVRGREHPATLRAMGTMANQFLSEQGRYAEAEQLYRRILGIRQRVLGEEHRETRGAMSAVAFSLYQQRRFAEAEQIFRQLNDMKWLTYCLWNQRKYVEAETACRQLLETAHRVRGKEHPDTLGITRLLAGLLSGQGRHAEAEQLLREVIEIQERVLGKEDPQTLLSMEAVAHNLYRQGHFAEAETIYRQVLEGQERVLVKGHPATLTSMANVGSSLYDQGRFAEAEQMVRQLLEVQERIFGKEHEKTFDTMDWLARCLENQGKNDEAEPILRQVLEIRQRVQGKEHADTLYSRMFLARSLWTQGKRDESERLYRDALETAHLVSEEDPDTLTSVMRMGERYLQGEAESEQLELFRRLTFEVRQRVFGKAHEKTLAAMNEFGRVLLKQEKSSEAERLFKEALETPEIHPQYARVYFNWGNTLADLGRRAEACEKYAKAAEVDPQFAVAYTNWGNALWRLGRDPEACEKYAKVAELQPQDARAYFNWGFVLGRSGCKADACEKYAKAAELNPQYMEAYHNWGLELVAMGEHDEAIEKFRKAIELKPDCRTYAVRGLACYHQRRYDQAILDYTKAAELEPGHAGEVYWRVRIFLAQEHLGQDGKVQLAEWRKGRQDEDWTTQVVRMYLGEITPEVCVDAAADKDPERDRKKKCEGYYYVGELYLLRGDKERARELFRQCVDTGVTLFDEYQSARIALKRLAEPEEK